MAARSGTIFDMPVVPERSRTRNSLLRAGHTDAVETVCIFGKLAYFRILFRHESLELLFLTGFLLGDSASQNDKNPQLAATESR